MRIADKGPAPHARAVDVIAAQIEIIRDALGAEPPEPVIVDVEPAGREHMAAIGFFAERLAVAVKVLLVSDAGLDVEIAGPEALAVFDPGQRAHVFMHLQREGDVLMGRQRDVIGLLIEDAHAPVAAEIRRQKPGRLRGGRIGMREER